MTGILETQFFSRQKIQILGRAKPSLGSLEGHWRCSKILKMFHKKTESRAGGVTKYPYFDPSETHRSIIT